MLYIELAIIVALIRHNGLLALAELASISSRPGVVGLSEHSNDFLAGVGFAARY